MNWEIYTHSKLTFDSNRDLLYLQPFLLDKRIGGGRRLSNQQMTNLSEHAEGTEILGEISPGFEEILTPEAIGLIALLQREYGAERDKLLARRIEIQKKLVGGWTPGFLPETKEVRESDWTVAPLPDDLMDRRVEITGPTDRKMVINALNSGASIFMTDFEDSNAPTWDNMVRGHINLRDAILGTIDFKDPASGKEYSLNEKTAVLLVRPRGWHLPEKHMLVDGKPVSGSLFDFALYLFHNHQALKAKGTGPYYYLPKLENHLEARLWNQVITRAQEALSIPNGTVKATVLIETILASFELNEILYELRDHSAGLNCGRWDYLFSFIKKFRNDPNYVLPDRGQVGMTQHFMRSYSLLVIKTCHRRNVHAIGGMAAQIPVRNDEAANAEAMAKVTADKKREANDGHDGTWVAHPGLVSIAKDIFDRVMPQPNQIDKKREDVNIEISDLLALPEGTITEAGLRQNLNVGICYTEAWLRGNGCVALYNLMEDAATAEISRTQIWQWIKHEAKLEDGRTIDQALFEKTLTEEMGNIRATVGDAAFDNGKYQVAAGLFRDLSKAGDFSDFLTLPAYEMLD